MDAQYISVRTIMHILCQNRNCECTLSTLASSLGKAGMPIPSFVQLTESVESYPDIFVLSDDGSASTTTVSVKAKVPLCEEYQTKKAECSKEGCNGLHVCRLFLLSDSCTFSTDKRPCMFGHELSKAHNKKIMRSFCLDELDVNDVKTVLKCPRNRTSFTTPKLCNHFQRKNCQKMKCNFLHLCRDYLSGSCSRGSECQGHNVFAEEVIAMLIKYGIEQGRGEDEIIEDLRVMGVHDDGHLKNKQAPRGQADLKPSRDREQSYGKASNFPPSNQQPRMQGHYSQSSNPYMTQHPSTNQQRMPYKFRNPEGPRPRFQHPPSPQGQYRQAPPYGFQGPRQQYLEQQGPWSQQQQQGCSSPYQNVQMPPPPFQHDVDTEIPQKDQHGQQRDQNEPGTKAVTAQPQKDSEDICMFDFDIRKCAWKEKCHNHHRRVTYQWQHRVKDGKVEEKSASEEKDQPWRDFDYETNTSLEEAYSDPSNDTCPVAYRKGEIVTVKFEDMSGSSNRTKITIRRLSTPSSESPSIRPSTYKWTTVWRWYWQNEPGTWIEYGKKDDRAFTSQKKSEDIEKAFLSNPAETIEFGTSGFKYKLKFNSMIQINTATEKERPVRRRPVYFKKEELKKRSVPDRFVTKTGPVGPVGWSIGPIKSNEQLAEHEALILVDTTSEEYQKVSDLFFETVPRNNTIKSVERVEYGCLWKRFNEHRENMKLTAGNSVEEKCLFHGTTKDAVEAICKQGFDFRRCGSRVGARFGQGAYFAKEAKYSDSYAEKAGDTKRMFVTRVLVGEFTKGDSSYKWPPAKGSENPHDTYDSCVDDVKDPKIFVVFDRSQAYPEYIITYAVPDLQN